MHEPLTCTTKSELAANQDGEPKHSPKMPVTNGTRRMRRPRPVPAVIELMPSEPRMSGMRAPPASPRNTKGWPFSTACMARSCALRVPTRPPAPASTVTSSAATATVRPSIRP